MTVEILTIGGGIVLLILSAIGGGIEAKEIKIPQLPTITRVISAFAGIALIGLGIVLKQPSFMSHPHARPTVSSAPIEAQATTAVSEPRKEIFFTITDRLSSNQLSESIEVFLDGNRIGLLEINEANPVATVEHSVSEPGTYQYRMHGTLRYRSPKEVFVRQLSGSGAIQVQKGSVFFVHLKDREKSHALVSLSTEP